MGEANQQSEVDTTLILRDLQDCMIVSGDGGATSSSKLKASLGILIQSYVKPRELITQGDKDEVGEGFKLEYKIWSPWNLTLSCCISGQLSILSSLWQPHRARARKKIISVCVPSNPVMCIFPMSQDDASWHVMLRLDHGDKLEAKRGLS